MTEFSHEQLLDIIENSAWVPEGDLWKARLNDLSKKLSEVKT